MRNSTRQPRPLRPPASPSPPPPPQAGATGDATMRPAEDGGTISSGTSALSAGNTGSACAPPKSCSRGCAGGGVSGGPCAERSWETLLPSGVARPWTDPAGRHCCDAGGRSAAAGAGADDAGAPDGDGDSAAEDGGDSGGSMAAAAAAAATAVALRSRSVATRAGQLVARRYCGTCASSAELVGFTGQPGTSMGSKASQPSSRACNSSEQPGWSMVRSSAKGAWQLSNTGKTSRSWAPRRCCSTVQRWRLQARLRGCRPPRSSRQTRPRRRFASRLPAPGPAKA
mmetsp:Transcript_103840/g.332812  ORF Transcript_103840/g.332812 Transcript_103840/m.332812 type:complete len:284 (-) Transcript_103840:923-1774(-)